MSVVNRVIGLTTILLLATVACAGPAAGPGGSDSGAPARATPKRLTIGIRGDLQVLDPRALAVGGGASIGSVPGANEVERMVNGGLVITDHEGNPRPELAREVPTVENGLWKLLSDGRMEVTWHLRDGITWHDGAPFTSEDAVFTTQIEGDPEASLVRSAAYRSIERVEAPDPQTVRVLWKEPYVRADDMFNTFALPVAKHLLEDVFLNQKATLMDHKYWRADYVGTGPYRVRAFTPMIGTVLDANPSYVLGAPRIDQIEVRFIPDPNTLGANLLAGEIDMTLGGRLSLDWALQVRDRWAAGKMVTGELGTPIVAWPQFLNPDPAILANVDFRRALFYAADRQVITDSLLQGLSPVAHTLVGPTERGYHDIEPSIVKYGYDPQRANQLIGSLGYTKGTDGSYRNASGPLRVEMRARANDEMQVKVLLSVADYWERLGVGVDQVHFPQQLADDREWRASRPAFEVVRNGNLEYLARFRSSEIPQSANRFAGGNRPRYANPEVDGLIDRFLTTIPFGERMGYASSIIHHLSDQAVFLPVLYDAAPTMMANSLMNVAGPGTSWDVYLWDVK